MQGRPTVANWRHEKKVKTRICSTMRTGHHIYFQARALNSKITSGAQLPHSIASDENHMSLRWWWLVGTQMGLVLVELSLKLHNMMWKIKRFWINTFLSLQFPKSRPEKYQPDGNFSRILDRTIA